MVQINYQTCTSWSQIMGAVVLGVDRIQWRNGHGPHAHTCNKKGAAAWKIVWPMYIQRIDMQQELSYVRYIDF